MNNIVKEIERKCFTNVDYLVVTSEKFYSVYYHNLIEREKTIFIPNAPDKYVFEKYKKKDSGCFTVGFIGGIRYLEQMKMLVDATELCGCNVLFAGAGGTISDYEEIRNYCSTKDWVKFTGKYNYEKDIATLYGQVDCIYAVYNADNPNVRIALPNKLYESIYCCLPIIVAKGTYLSELVEKWDVGISICHKSVDELCSAINIMQFDQKRYKELSDNCKKISEPITSEKHINQLINAL